MQRFNLHWAGISRGASGEENFLNGVKTIYSWSEPFTAEGILSLNSSVFPEAPGFRATKAQCLSEAHDPPDAILVERLTANAVGWFGTEGFDGMNPVEQATLVYLRFMDLQAFAKGNEVMAVLLASYPLIRAGLPPLIFQATDPRYLAALESGFRMLTQHLVNFIAETLASYPAMEF